MSEDVIRVLFTKIDRMAEDVAAIKVKIEEREKRCNEHAEKTRDHEKRLRIIEDWKAGHQGIAGAIQRWGPVAISAAIGIYVAVKK